MTLSTLIATVNLRTILATIAAIGLLIVFCSEHDRMMQKTGWGVSAIATIALGAHLIWG